LALLIGLGATPRFSYGIPRETVLAHPAKVADLMIDAGLNFGSYDSKATLLHRAAWWGHKEVVEDLIELGANVNAVDGVGGTPLHAAIQSGCTRYLDVIHGPYADVLEVLIQHGAHVNATNNWNMTPLHGAAGYGDVNAVELLIKYGADVNIISKTGQSPLHSATLRGSTDVMALLITQGADPNIVDNEGNTPLQLLLFFYQGMQDRAGMEIRDYIIKLVRQGVKVDVQNYQGVTPLQQAAALGYPDLVEAFLIRGAPVTPKATTGWTALHSAVASGNAKCVKMLLERNAKINIPGTLPDMIRLPRFRWPARTPLHIAISQRDNTIVSLLIAAGADVNAIDGYQKTPLQLAIDINNLEAVKLLRDSGAFSNPK
jgi:ankyrin repeat protein